MSGVVHTIRHESKALEGNGLNDPLWRDLYVYLPHDYSATERYPVAMFLPGYSGRGQSMLASGAWAESMPEMLDRLIETSQIRPFICVFPDCWTTLGGSQYLNSAMGNYQDYLVELADYVDKSYATMGPESRALIGHSSGGFGAMRMAMDRSEAFPYIADHAGDKVFNLCYQPEFPDICTALNGWNLYHMLEHPLEVSRINHGEAGDKPKTPNFMLMNHLAMCWAYTPKGEAVESPIADTETCEINPNVWGRWLSYDPAFVIENYIASGYADPQAFAKTKYLYMDCGARDEYKLQYCCRQFQKKFEAYKKLPQVPSSTPHQGLSCVSAYAEFSDGHRRTSYRYARSLQVFSEAMG